MTKINVDEALLRRLIAGTRDQDWEAAATAEKLLPIPLPTEVGTIIMWRENGIGTFAERVHVEGEDQWRHNGFDLLRDTSMEIELRGKTWWEMVKK